GHLDTPSLGDVPRLAQDAPAPQPARPQVDGDVPPVLAAQVALGLDGALRLQALPSLGELAALLRWRDVGHSQAEQLHLGVSQHRAELRIRHDEAIVAVDHDDAVDRMLGDRAVVAHALAQLVLHAGALRDVPHEHQDLVFAAGDQARLPEAGAAAHLELVLRDLGFPRRA